MSEEKINPFSNAPLCRVTEAVTLHELKMMYVAMVRNYEKESWFNFNIKWQLMGACAMLESLVHWINEGKK
jgi:hypothetical protein